MPQEELEFLNIIIGTLIKVKTITLVLGGTQSQVIFCLFKTCKNPIGQCQMTLKNFKATSMVVQCTDVDKKQQCLT